MSFQFACPQCGQTFNAPSHAAGQKSKCPKCKASILIPTQVQSPPTVSEAAYFPWSTVMHSLVAAAILIILLLVLVTALKVESRLAQIEAQLSRNPVWEYQVATIADDKFGQQMNTLGTAGWELVFARRASSGPPGVGRIVIFSYEVILKRESQSTKKG